MGVRRPLHAMIAFAAAAGEVDVDGFNAGERASEGGPGSPSRLITV